MKRVFVDTGGFVALLVPGDGHHAEATELWERANRERWQFVTTNAVVFETYAFLRVRSRDGRRNALTFLDLVLEDAYSIERVREEDERRAIEILRSYGDQAYSFCDALSFASSGTSSSATRTATEAIGPNGLSGCVARYRGGQLRCHRLCRATQRISRIRESLCRATQREAKRTERLSCASEQLSRTRDRAVRSCGRGGRVGEALASSSDA